MNTILRESINTLFKSFSSTRQVFDKNTALNIYILAIFTFILSFGNKAEAQNGYIYLHHQATNEEASPNFTFNVAGGIFNQNYTLNDQTDFLSSEDLGASQSGRLWALARIQSDAAFTNWKVYYRDVNSSTWNAITTLGSPRAIDGGIGSTAIYSTNAASGTTGRVYSVAADGTTTDITGDLPAGIVYDVSDNWLPFGSGGRQYASVQNGDIYQRTTAALPAVWTVIFGTPSHRVDAVPKTNNLYYVVGATTTAGSTIFYRDVTAGASINLGAGSSNSDDMAITEDGTVIAGYKKMSGTPGGTVTWTDDVQGMYGFNVTGGPNNQFWASVGITDVNNGNTRVRPNRIMTRTATSNWIDDERIRATGTNNDNSVLISVAPGTYTITEATEPSGWRLQSIASDPTGTTDVAAKTTTITVAANATTHVVYANVNDIPFAMPTDCTTGFTENFGTTQANYASPTISSGYHNGAPTLNGTTASAMGYGYYGLINNSNLITGDLASGNGVEYTTGFTDHTSGTGRMLGVNATGQPRLVYQKRLTGLTVGTAYTYSAWVRSADINAGSLPNIGLQVLHPTTGAILFNAASGTITNANPPAAWKQVTLNFTATTTSIDIAVASLTAGAWGNDFTVDDISVLPVKPTAPTLGAITQPTCSALGSVVLNGLPAVGNWTITDSNGGATMTGTGSTATFVNLAAGSHTFTVTVGTCVSLASASATINAQPVTPTAVILATGPTILCPSGSVTLVASPATTYQWYNGAGAIAGATNQNYVATVAGTYYVVETANGCTSANSNSIAVTIQDNVAPVFVTSTGTQVVSDYIDYDAETNLITGNFPRTIGSGAAMVTVNQSINGSNTFFGITSPTGAPAPYGNGGLVFAVTGSNTQNRTNTLTFPQKIQNLKFSLYDLDGTVPLTFKAYNNGTLTNVTVSKLELPATSSSSSIVISNNGTTNTSLIGAVGGWGETTQSNLRKAGINVDVAGPVDSLVLVLGIGETNGSSYDFGDLSFEHIVNTQVAATLPADVTVTCDAIPVAPTLLATDNCGTATVVPTETTAANTPGTGQSTITRTWTATDGSGNTTVHVQKIIVNPASVATVTAGSATTFCAGGSVVLTSSATTGNQWYLNNNPISGATDQIYTANASGSYTVISTTGTCSTVASTPIVVTVNPLPTAFTVTGGGTKCAGLGGAGIVVGLSGSETNVNYQLQLDGVNSGAPVAGTGAAITFGNFNTAGTYTVIATGTTTPACSATMTGNAVIIINPLPATPTITAGGSTTFCAGGNVALSSSATSGNQWYLNGNPISGAINQTYTATATGSYSVITTDGNTCPSAASAAVNVTVTALPTSPTIGAITQPTCAVQTGSVALSGLPTGAWTITTLPATTTTTGSGATTTISGLPAGTTYKFIVTNTATTCSSAASADAVINTAPALATIPGPITGLNCVLPPATGVAYSVPAVPGAISYSWTYSGSFASGGTANTTLATFTSNNISINFAENATSGTLSVTVTTACGTSTASTLAITVLPKPSIATLGSSTICPGGGSVILTSTPAPAYQWYKDGNLISGATSQNYTANGTGNYTVVTSSGSCTSLASNVFNVIEEDTTLPVFVSPLGTETKNVKIDFRNASASPLFLPQTYNNIETGALANERVKISQSVSGGQVQLQNAPAFLYTADATGPAAYGNDKLLFISNLGDPIRSLTMNFDQSVTNLNFSLLDIDGGTKVEARAYNNGVLQPITMVPLRTVPAPTNTAPSASPSTTPTINGASNAYTIGSLSGTRTGGINVSVPSPNFVNSFVLAYITRANADNSVYLSQISYDYTAPVLPGDVTVNCDAIPAPVVLTATDNCSTASVTYTQVPAVFVPSTSTQTITRTWVATDAVGNTSSHTQTITVNPTTLLTITNPATVCAPATVDLTAPAVIAGSATGTVLSYYTDASATIALANPNAVATSGTYYIKATTATCMDIKPVVVTINPLPVAQTVTGGGSTCAGSGVGFPVGLANSETGISYQLQIDGVNTGTAVAGTGSAISFGNQTAAGTYTVLATGTTTPACSVTMTGNAVITINPLPATPTLALTQPTCTVSTGTITVTAPTGMTSYSVTGTSPVTATITNSTGIFTGLAAGTYDVIATNSNNCTSSAAAAVLVTANCPALTFVKTGTFVDTNANGRADAGDHVTYAFTVTNTGNTTITGITITDAKVTVTGGPITLAPGASNSSAFTADYTILQSDVDKGGAYNVATATGKDPNNNNVTATSTNGNPTDPSTPVDPACPTCTITPLPKTSTLTLVKTGTFVDTNANGRADAGDHVTYAFTVTNTGNTTITGITITDPKVAVSGGPITLAPGAVNSTAFTADYTILQSDVDKGGAYNVATATGKDPNSNNVTATSTNGNPTDPSTPVDPTCPTCTITPLPKTSTLTLVKIGTFVDTNANGRADAGDHVTYAFTVTNTGNTTITGITITDPKVAVSGGPITLAPGAVNSTAFTADYTVTQADVDKGGAYNVATATGKDPNNNNVTATSTNGNPTDPSTPVDPACPSCTITPLPKTPSMTFTKVVTGTVPSTVGATITYALKVTNTGNVTLSNIIVTDPNATVTGSPITSLSPGAEVTLTATHVLTQADLDAGKVSNQAIVKATTPDGTTTPDKPSDNPNTPDVDDPTVTPVTPNPSMTFTKVVTGTVPNTVGATITYALKVTNTGNVTLSNIIVTDANATVTGSPITSLSPGAEVTLTATHVLTQADLDAGKVTNQAIVKATTPGGTTTPDKPSDNPNTPDVDDPTVTPVTPNPSMTFTKVVTGTVPNTVGATITYALKVTNTGNVTLSNIIVTDANATVAGSPIASLAPGAEVTLTATHILTQADLDAGKVSNQAIVKATTPGGTTTPDKPSDNPNTPEVDDPTVTPVTPNPSMTFTKVVTGTVPNTVGATITYALKVTNTGNVTLSNIIVTDANATVAGSPIASLAPGADVTLTATHLLTQADLDEGKVSNQAIMKATTPGGTTTPDKPSDNPNTPEVDDPTVTPVTPNPSMTFTKVVTGTVPNTVGATITYALKVTNTGNVTLSNIIVTDANATVTGSPIASLAPGAEVTLTATHILTQADLDAGKVSNQAIVKATTPGGTTTPDKPSDNPNTPEVDDPTVTQVTPNPSMTLTKVANNTVSKVGDVINYTLIVKNTGNVTLTNIVVTDTGADVGSITPSIIASIIPGETATVNAKHTVKQADVDAGKFSNQASAGGTAPGNVPVTDPKSDDPTTVAPDDETVTPIIASPSMTLTKIANNTGTKAGDVINYTLVVKNTGNVTLKNITITDTGADAGSITPATIASLAPDATAMVTAKHTLTQTEINSGSFSNQASATGLDPKENPVVDPKSDDPNTPAVDDPTVVKIIEAGKISLVKTGVISPDGNTITYTFTIKNIGNVTLYSITLSDPKLGLNKVIAVLGGLAPGSTVTDTEVYTLTQADKDLGTITNTATVTSKSPTGADVTDVSGTDETNNTPTVVKFVPNPSISIVKTGIVTDNYITYTFTIKNAGNVTLFSLTLTDAKLGITNKTIVLPSGLLPGATTVITEKYILTQGDKDAGQVTNTATVTAKDPNGNDVSDVSGTTETNNTPTVTVVPKSPIAVDDNAETKANKPVVIPVLANDTPGTTTVTVEIVNQPANGTLKINADGTVTYTPNPGYTGTDSFTYRIKDQYGYYSNIATVSVQTDFFEIRVPNLFTPNGDGTNDTFEIRGLNQFAQNDLVILNRWGNEVYKSSNYQNNWTGEGLNEGTYYYLLKVKRAGSSEWVIFKGYITLIRAFKK
ncbi:DUF7507 domain-containing protein [Pedobacter paludis]|uniref:Uncharacterized protein n=1 Tax=Pedobacter paludis TaxID=2203212 RepID=A0A317EV15_9SPHI|nr:gliding motility-associated C-terminal domain-containing protein [Pedobacter paludis]PWS30564.1 hypothetical protein DF947_16640 [Pedobacter paludis]